MPLRTPMPLSESEREIEGLQGPEMHQYGEDMHVHLYFLDRTTTV